MDEKGLEFFRQKSAAFRAEIRKAITGQDEVLDMMLACVLCGGHAILEGVPGTAKTLMVRALARTLSVRFGRIQFTPDLMPSDILGTNVYDMNQGQFRLRKGPIFADMLLADEINRAPAKTQAALLEAMQERKATIDGVGQPLGDLFTVFATQNPIEYEGTYRLPEAQLDRFLFKINVGYPSAEEEDAILRAFHSGAAPDDLDRNDLKPMLSPEELRTARALLVTVKVEPPVMSYLRQIVWATRGGGDILIGCGPRASIHLLLASKANAALRGAPFVTPDDVKSMALPVLRHRVILTPEAQVEGISPDDAVRRLFEKVPVPR